MKKSIQLQWIKENRLHKKNVETEKIEEILKETEENKLSEKVGAISEVEAIYINFDRNKKKNEEEIWIRYSYGEKCIEGNQYKLFYLKLCDCCK